MKNNEESKGKRTKLQSFRMMPELLYKIKIIGAFEDKSQGDIIEEVLLEYVAKYEKKHGPLPSKAKK